MLQLWRVNNLTFKLHSGGTSGFFFTVKSKILKNILFLNGPFIRVVKILIDFLSIFCLNFLKNSQPYHLSEKKTIKVIPLVNFYLLTFL